MRYSPIAQKSNSIASNSTQRTGTHNLVINMAINAYPTIAGGATRQ